MRRILLESLLRRAAHRAAADPDAATRSPNSPAQVDRAARAGSAAALRSARSMPARATAASWKSTRCNNAFYDLERFGLRFVASPRHADVLLVTGPVTKNMQEALLRTYRRDAGAEMGRRGRGVRHSTAACSPAAMPASGRRRWVLPVTSPFRAARRRRPTC